MNTTTASEDPTHTALANPDILDLILDNLDVGFVWKLPPNEVVWRRKVLAAMALTCRTFQQPALDRLWKSLDKLFPLFKLLPAFYRSDSTFVLRGHVSETDWARFDSYAGRVKSFCYTRDPDSLDIAMHVYFRIAQLRKKPLLPSLQHLRCPHISQDDFLISSICLFLTPSLRVLDFDKITGVEDKLIGTFLHTLLCEGARIEKLFLLGEGLTKDTLGYLGQCVYLRSLIVHGMGACVDMELVRALGRIPGLEKLCLDLEGSRLMSVSLPPLVAASSPTLSPALGAGAGAGAGTEMMVVDGLPTSSPNSSTAWEGGLGYRELTEFEFNGPLSFLKSFLEQIGTTQLRYIHIDSSSEGAVDRRDLLGLIAQRWRNTLKYFRLAHNDNEVEEEDSAPPAITMDTLSPLLKVTQLIHLEVDEYLLELRDSNITEMAAAWPNIRELHLPFMVTGTQRPTVISLQTLSKCCPDLHNLVIPLDTSDFNTIEAAAAATTPTTPTTTSTITESLISVHKLHTFTMRGPDEPWELARVMVLARVVDQLFPNLVLVQAAEPHEGGRWQQVHQVVRMCQSVRSEAMQMYSSRQFEPR